MLRLKFQFAAVIVMLLGLPTAYASDAKAETQAPKTTQAAPSLQPISEATARARAQHSATGLYEVLAGYFNLQRGNTTQAYRHLLNASKKYPSASLFQMAIESALKDDSPKRADAALKQWLAAMPHNARAHLNRIRLYIQNHDVAGSSSILQSALSQIAPKQQHEFLYNLPAVYAPAKPAQAALKVLQPELQKALDNPHTRYIAAIALARIYLTTEQYQEALDTLKHTKHATIPKDKLGTVPNAELPALVAVTVMRALPPANTHQDIYQQAQAIVQEAVRNHTASKQIYLTYIKALLERKQFETAQQQLQAFRKQYPKSLTGHMLSGAIALEQKKWKTAQRALLEYVKLRKRGITMEAPTQQSAFVGNLLSTKHTAQTDIRVYAMLARAAEMVRIKQRSAPAIVRKWLGHAAETAEAKTLWLQHIDWLTRTKHHQRAIQRIQQLAQKDPSITPTVRAFMVSHIYERQKQYDTAINILNNALQQAPENTDILYARGLAYDSSGKHAQAERDYRRILAINPKSSAALNALGYGLADRNERLEEAHQLILQAIKLDPANGAIQDSVGWVKYRMGKLDEALVWLKKAFVTAPQADVAAHLGEVLWKTGKKTLARKLWQKALQNEPDNDVLRETVRRLAPTLKSKPKPKSKP